MMQFSLICLLIALGSQLWGCQRAEEGAVTPAVSKGEVPRTNDACKAISLEFSTVVRQHVRCTRDADCACYPSGVDCGGVAARATVKRLETLLRMHRLSRCPGPKCQRSPCTPSCVAGRCVQAASALAGC